MIQDTEYKDLQHNFIEKLKNDGYWTWGVIYYESRDYLCSSPGAIVVHAVLIGIDSDDYSTLSAHETALYKGSEIVISIQEAREKCFDALKEKIGKKYVTCSCNKCGGTDIQHAISPGDETLVEGCVWAEVKCTNCGESIRFPIHPKENKSIEIARQWNNRKGKEK